MKYIQNNDGNKCTTVLMQKVVGKNVNKLRCKKGFFGVLEKTIEFSRKCFKQKLYTFEKLTKCQNY